MCKHTEHAYILTRAWPKVMRALLNCVYNYFLATFFGAAFFATTFFAGAFLTAFF
jgi:hypothetical protein